MRRCPVLRAPYFEQEVVGPEMLDRLAGRAVRTGGHDPAAVLHDALTQELMVAEDGARLRLALPFARKGDISLKKIGLELIVRVDGQKRTIMLPPALAAFSPTAATFEDGALEVTLRRGWAELDGRRGADLRERIGGAAPAAGAAA